MTTAAIQDVLQFTKGSMDWCIKDSEKIVTQISQVLMNILNDSERVGKMTQATLKLVIESREQVLKLIAETKVTTSQEAGRLVSTLSKLCESNQDLQSVAMPVIEALQFQDRIRQKMENLGKMFDLWIVARENAKDRADVVSMAESFLKCTTTIEERNVIRQCVPELPEEEVQESGFEFF